jgi:branched-chain amino acid transport system substrate-binding protein
MNEAAKIHIQGGPLSLPGITISTSATDYAPIKQMQMMKFDGNTWNLFGEVISGSGT